jgi:hypothetical protein
VTNDRTFTVSVSFESTNDTPLTDALRALRGLVVDAPSAEGAEHYATLIIRALEDMG